MPTVRDGSPASPIPGSTPEDRRIRSTRADFAFEAVMADRMYSATRKVFGWRHWWMTRTYERLAPVAATWSAVCTLASLPDHVGVRDVLPLLLDCLPAYHRDGPPVITGAGPAGFESNVVPPLGRGGVESYADNARLGLALVRHHELSHDEVALPLAQRLFEFVISGWVEDDGWHRPGGIRSVADPTHTQRHTCAHAAAATLGARLHQLTGDPVALEWAIRLYHWTRGALLRDDDLYADCVAPDGTVGSDVWTDDQGSMLGAGVVLSSVTGDHGYLLDARATASAALAHFGLDELIDNGPARNAVYFRNLFLLSDPAMSPMTSRGRALASEYDDLLWEDRDRHSGLIAGSGSPLSRMGPLIELDALLAGAPPHP